MNARAAGRARLFRVEADYTGPLFELSPELRAEIRSLLVVLYGEGPADGLTDAVERVLRVHQAHKLPEALAVDDAHRAAERFSEEDVVLITYGDLIVSKERTPLRTLAIFAKEYLAGRISTIHLLPFFPWSSDRGFAVVSYRLVDSNLGTWDDVAALGDDFRLMFDGVVNHASSHSRWFEDYRSGHPDYDDFFVGFDSPDAIAPDDLKAILRPRTSLLTSSLRWELWSFTL